MNTSHASEKQSWESQLVTLTNSHSLAVAEHETIINHFHSHISDWERKHNELQTHIQFLNTNHETKNAELLETKNENKKLQHDLAAHLKTAEHLHEARVQLHKFKEQFAQSTEAWDAEKKEYESHVEKLMEDIHDYHTKTAEHLNLTRARLHSFEQHAGELQTRVKNYELLVSDLEAELARLRAGGKTLIAETSVKAIIQVKEPQKLEIVEGIGPKIAQLLNNAGIYTFLQLSESNFETLKKILDNAGPRFRMHDPHTWPAQAALAHKGDWDELKVYQNHLKGGKENG